MGNIYEVFCNPNHRMRSHFYEVVAATVNRLLLFCLQKKPDMGF